MQQKETFKAEAFFKSCEVEEDMDTEGNEARRKEEILKFSWRTPILTAGKNPQFHNFHFPAVVCGTMDDRSVMGQLNRKRGRDCFQLQFSSGRRTTRFAGSNHAAALASASAPAVGESHIFSVSCLCDS